MIIRVLDVVVAGGLALTTVLATSSGFTVKLFGVAIQLHDWMRPLVATAVLAVIRIFPFVLGSGGEHGPARARAGTPPMPCGISLASRSSPPS